MDQALKQQYVIIESQGRGSRRVRECMGNRIIIDDNEVTTYELHHYRRLTWENLICLGLAFLILTVEKLAKTRTRVKVMPILKRERRIPAAV